MAEDSPHKPSITQAIRRRWSEEAADRGYIFALRSLLANFRGFVRDSTPSRRRQRYGDVDFDWDNRVDTTSGTVGWRNRLLGIFHSPYQPTDPTLFREMLAALAIDFREFTFIDIGSGKGRALLMAAEYPFRRIVGIELLPGLHRVARDNIAKYKSTLQQGFAIEALCGDARDFVFPPEPSVVYLFNPLPEAGLKNLLQNLERSLSEKPRLVLVLYHNPLLGSLLAGNAAFKKIAGTHQYSIFASATV